MLNRRELAAVFRAVRTQFNLGLSSAQPNRWRRFAAEVRSTGRSELHAWLAAIGSLIPWVGSRQIDNVDGKQYELINRKFQRAVGIKTDDVRDGNLAAASQIAMRMGAAAMAWPDEQIFAAIEAGFEEKCYTGKTFFNTQHRIAKKNFSNKLTVALQVDTQANIIASLGEAIALLEGAWDDSGRPVRVMPDALLVPPALRGKATIACNSERLDDGKQNPYHGVLEVIVEPFLTDPNNWYVCGKVAGMEKPILWQIRQDPQIDVQDDPSSDSVFEDDEIRYGVSARGVAGYGAPQLMIGSQVP